MRARRTLLVLVVTACSDGAAAPPPPSASSTAPAPPTADRTRATTILKAQVASLRSGDAALVASFAADAVVLVPDARAAHGETTGLREAIARLGPHDTLKDIRLGKVVADATPAAVWWSAELTMVAESREPESSPHKTETTLRVTELATADSGWKVVAGAFAAAARPENRADPDEIDTASTTAAGPLTPLLADPAKLELALAPRAVVFGTDKGEAAWDTAAHALLKKWSKLALSINGAPREVRGKGWGFAIANVDWKQPKEKSPARMAALVIATPTTVGGWQVVAAQYTAY